MKTYNKPKLNIALFERESIITESVVPEGDYSANMLNEMFFSVKGVSMTTTVHLQKIKSVLELK